jgi:RNA methyltransferase, TrmH family
MIRSRQNETIKAIRQLRRKQGEIALLEGPHLVEEALKSGIQLESLLVSPAFLVTAAGLRLASRLPSTLVEVEERLLDSLADSDSPRGILALARLPRGGADRFPVDPSGLYLFLDGVQDPGNLGAIARVGEAFEVRAMALGRGCAHPNHPRALRGSAGSLLRLPVARVDSADELDRALGSIGTRWAGLDAHGSAPLPRSRPDGAWVLALGGEASGLSKEVEGRLDLRWTIPLARRVESLNVAVAAGIALFALARPSA